TLEVRERELQAARYTMALPDRRIPAEVQVGQGRPAAPARPTRDEAVAVALPWPRVGRARVRTLEARVRARAAPHSRAREGRAPRRPRDARAPQSGARPSASRTA